MGVDRSSIMVEQGSTYVSIRVNLFAAEAIDMGPTVAEEVAVATDGLYVCRFSRAEPCSCLCTSFIVR